jgi:hypothetical protein
MGLAIMVYTFALAQNKEKKLTRDYEELKKQHREQSKRVKQEIHTQKEQMK